MIKELWILVKMLFASTPKDIDQPAVIDMQHFPFKGYKAMAWCGYIIHRIGSSAVNQKTINHERIHLMQAKVCGSWFKYYLAYLWEWIKPGFMSPLSANYYVNKYEAEAYANEENPEYWKNYTKDSIKKYTFKNPKTLYRKVGGTPEKWKAYVKSL